MCVFAHSGGMLHIGRSTESRTAAHFEQAAGLAFALLSFTGSMSGCWSLPGSAPRRTEREWIMKYRIMFVTGMMLVCIAGLAHAQTENLARNHAVLMEKKLASAQAVLAGLARNNFEEIEKQAQMLSLLSHEAAWNVIQTQEYSRQSEAFRNTTQQMQDAAASQNADAVALSYVKLTISCIDCHRYARTQQAAAPPAGGR